MKLLIITLSGLFLFSNACQKKSKDMLVTIQNAEEVECFRIDDFATAPEAQVATETYFMDYKIIETIALTDSQKIELKNKVSNPDIYINSVARTCPFIGEYGFSFRKDKQFVNMIISKKNCPKCMFTASGVKEMKMLDFVEGVNFGAW